MHLFKSIYCPCHAQQSLMKHLLLYSGNQMCQVGFFFFVKRKWYLWLQILMQFALQIIGWYQPVQVNLYVIRVYCFDYIRAIWAFNEMTSCHSGLVQLSISVIRFNF